MLKAELRHAVREGNAVAIRQRVAGGIRFLAVGTIDRGIRKRHTEVEVLVFVRRRVATHDLLNVEATGGALVREHNRRTRLANGARRGGFLGAVHRNALELEARGTGLGNGVGNALRKVCGFCSLATLKGDGGNAVLEGHGRGALAIRAADGCVAKRHGKLELLIRIGGKIGDKRLREGESALKTVVGEVRRGLLLTNGAGVAGLGEGPASGSTRRGRILVGNKLFHGVANASGQFVEGLRLVVLERERGNVIAAVLLKRRAVVGVGRLAGIQAAQRYAEVEVLVLVCCRVAYHRLLDVELARNALVLDFDRRGRFAYGARCGIAGNGEACSCCLGNGVDNVLRQAFGRGRFATLEGYGCLTIGERHGAERSIDGRVGERYGKGERLVRICGNIGNELLAHGDVARLELVRKGGKRANNEVAILSVFGRVALEFVTCRHFLFPGIGNASSGSVVRQAFDVGGPVVSLGERNRDGMCNHALVNCSPVALHACRPQSRLPVGLERNVKAHTLAGLVLVVVPNLGHCGLSLARLLIVGEGGPVAVHVVGVEVDGSRVERLLRCILVEYLVALEGIALRQINLSPSVYGQFAVDVLIQVLRRGEGPVVRLVEHDFGTRWIAVLQQRNRKGWRTHAILVVCVIPNLFDLGIDVLIVFVVRNRGERTVGYDAAERVVRRHTFLGPAIGNLLRVFVRGQLIDGRGPVVRRVQGNLAHLRCGRFAFELLVERELNLGGTKAGAVIAVVPHLLDGGGGEFHVVGVGECRLVTRNRALVGSLPLDDLARTAGNVVACGQRRLLPGVGNLLAVLELGQLSNGFGPVICFVQRHGVRDVVAVDVLRNLHAVGVKRNCERRRPLAVVVVGVVPYLLDLGNRGHGDVLVGERRLEALSFKLLPVNRKGEGSVLRRRVLQQRVVVLAYVFLFPAIGDGRAVVLVRGQRSNRGEPVVFGTFNSVFAFLGERNGSNGGRGGASLLERDLYGVGPETILVVVVVPNLLYGRTRVVPLVGKGNFLGGLGNVGLHVASGNERIAVGFCLLDPVANAHRQVLCRLLGVFRQFETCYAVGEGQVAKNARNTRIGECDCKVELAGVVGYLFAQHLLLDLNVALATSVGARNGGGIVGDGALAVGEAFPGHVEELAVLIRERLNNAVARALGQANCRGGSTVGKVELGNAVLEVHVAVALVEGRVGLVVLAKDGHLEVILLVRVLVARNVGSDLLGNGEATFVLLVGEVRRCDLRATRIRVSGFARARNHPTIRCACGGILLTAHELLHLEEGGRRQVVNVERLAILKGEGRNALLELNTIGQRIIILVLVNAIRTVEVGGDVGPPIVLIERHAEVEVLLLVGLRATLDRLRYLETSRPARVGELDPLVDACLNRDVLYGLDLFVNGALEREVVAELTLLNSGAINGCAYLPNGVGNAYRQATHMNRSFVVHQGKNRPAICKANPVTGYWILEEAVDGGVRKNDFETEHILSLVVLVVRNDLLGNIEPTGRMRVGELDRGAGLLYLTRSHKAAIARLNGGAVDLCRRHHILHGLLGNAIGNACGQTGYGALGTTGHLDVRSRAIGKRDAVELAVNARRIARIMVIGCLGIYKLNIEEVLCRRFGRNRTHDLLGNGDGPTRLRVGKLGRLARVVKDLALVTGRVGGEAFSRVVASVLALLDHRVSNAIGKAAGRHAPAILKGEHGNTIGKGYGTALNRVALGVVDNPVLARNLVVVERHDEAEVLLLVVVVGAHDRLGNGENTLVLGVRKDRRRKGVLYDLTSVARLGEDPALGRAHGSVGRVGPLFHRVVNAGGKVRDAFGLTALEGELGHALVERNGIGLVQLVVFVERGIRLGDVRRLLSELGVVVERNAEVEVAILLVCGGVVRRNSRLGYLKTARNAGVGEHDVRGLG